MLAPTPPPAMTPPDNTDDDTLALPPVSQPTLDALGRFAPLYTEEYRGFKTDLLTWLYTQGKNPFKREGYAEDTVKTTQYKIEQLYRWKWREEDAFTKEITPKDAEQYIDHLVRETTLSDREVRDFIKAIKRLFDWFEKTGRAEYDWEYSKISQLSQQQASNRQHYFEKREMAKLYDAALEYGSMKSYHTVTTEERDRLKAHLAQRFEKPKEEIGPDDFGNANSWKFPSLIAMTIDLGLRPIEIERAQTSWLRLHEEKVVIPKDESSKGEDPWECILSARATRALQNWLDEREGYKKYDDTKELWLTKYSNPYCAWSLNNLLNTLLELTDIKPYGRNLTWYALRRGSATMWAEEIDLDEARKQMRHKKLKTTRRYVKTSTKERRKTVNEMW